MVILQNDTSNLTGTGRIHGLDALRGIALILGVFLHASIPFMPSGMQLPTTPKSYSPLSMPYVYYIIHEFRMITFYIIAGFFSRMSLSRMEPKYFILDRSIRWGIPLIVGWFILVPAMQLSLILGEILSGRPVDVHLGDLFTTRGFRIFHLLFLYYLIIIALSFSIACMFLRYSGIEDKINVFIRNVWGLLKYPVFVGFAVALPTALAMYNIPHWEWWFGIPTPFKPLSINMPCLIIYSLAFIFGWACQSEKSYIQNIANYWWVYFIIALICTLTSLSISGFIPNLSIAPETSIKFEYAYLYSCAAWFLSLGLIGVSVKFLHSYNPFIRRLVDASFWIYLVHFPVVIFLGIILSRTTIYWLVSYSAIVLFTIAVLTYLYEKWIRSNVIGDVLRGTVSKSLISFLENRKIPVKSGTIE